MDHQVQVLALLLQNAVNWHHRWRYYQRLNLPCRRQAVASKITTSERRNKSWC